MIQAMATYWPSEIRTTRQFCTASWVPLASISWELYLLLSRIALLAGFMMYQVHMWSKDLEKTGIIREPRRVASVSNTDHAGNCSGSIHTPD